MTDYIAAILAVIGAFAILLVGVFLFIGVKIKRLPAYDEWSRIQGE